MDDYGALVFLLVVLWSVLGGLFGKARRGGQPPAPRPGPRPQARQRPGSAPPHGTTPGGAEAEAPGRAPAPVSAADMIPDELWEILTGEKRRPAPASAPPPEQPRAPAPVVVYEAEAELEQAEDEEPQPEVLPAREAKPVEVARPAGWGRSLEVEPQIVSLEAPLPSPAARHAAFHTRIAASAPPARGRTRRRAAAPLNLGDMTELRRMVVLREVLGPPKALE